MKDLGKDINQMIATKFFSDRSEKNYNAYYRVYYKIAYNSARKVFRNIDDAILVANDVMIKMHQNQNFNYDPDKPHVGYINRLAYTTALRHNNRLNRREKPISSDANYENILTEEETSVVLDAILEVRDIMSHAIRIIKPEYKDTVEIMMSGESYIDIAKEMSLSHSGIKLRAFRARNSIKKNAKEIENTMNILDGIKSKLPNDYTGKFVYNLNGERIVANFINGELHGEYLFTDENDVKIHGEYYKGYKNGSWEYYKGSSIYMAEEYEDDYLCVLKKYKDNVMVSEEYLI